MLEFIDMRPLRHEVCICPPDRIMLVFPGRLSVFLSRGSPPMCVRYYYGAQRTNGARPSTDRL